MFFIALDSFDQLHRVAESRLSDLISDAKLVIKNMQNKLFFDLFQNYFDIKIAKHWNSIIYKTKTFKNPPKTSLFSWKHFTQNWRFSFWSSVVGWFSVPCISAHFAQFFASPPRLLQSASINILNDEITLFSFIACILATIPPSTQWRSDAATQRHLQFTMCRKKLT